MTLTECNPDMEKKPLTSLDLVDMLQDVQEYYQNAALMATRKLWFELDDAQTRAEVLLYRVIAELQARG